MLRRWAVAFDQLKLVHAPRHGPDRDRLVQTSIDIRDRDVRSEAILEQVPQALTGKG